MEGRSFKVILRRLGPAFSDNTGFVNEVVKRNEVEQGFVFIVFSLITSFNYEGLIEGL